MVKYIILIAFISNLYCDDLQYLVRTTPNESAFETTANKLNNPSDDGSKQINIGFRFPFNGKTFTKVRISSNGALRLKGNGDFDYENEELPYKKYSIYPYWDDLNPEDGGEIRYESNGSGAEQRLIVSWENIPHYNDGGSYSIQAVLYINGTIRFRYDANSDADGGRCFFMFCEGATIGVEEKNSRFDQYSYKNTIDQRKDVLYTPKRGVVKSSCVIKDPINNTTNPKRIPSATIRYALEIKNLYPSDMSETVVEDNLNSIFNYSSIKYLQIQNGLCDCLGVASANNNGANGSSDGVNPVRLDFGTIVSGDIKCGYFEVDIK